MGDGSHVDTHAHTDDFSMCLFQGRGSSHAGELYAMYVMCTLSKAAGVVNGHGLRLVTGVYSGWTDYEGPWRASVPKDHLRQLDDQLTTAKALGPALAHVSQPWTLANVATVKRKLAGVSNKDGEVLHSNELPSSHHSRTQTALPPPPIPTPPPPPPPLSPLPPSRLTRLSARLQIAYDSPLPHA